MRDYSDTNKIPHKAGLYCLLGQTGNSTYDAYVGISNDVRKRMEQHLVRRNSSISTGVSAAALIPDNVVGAVWWTDPIFSDTTSREAAELIAFDILNPVLRSRGRIRDEARKLSQDVKFCTTITDIIGERTNKVNFLSPSDLRTEINELRDTLDEITNNE
jgi:hypothetical protein